MSEVDSIEEVKLAANKWQWRYNSDRPNMGNRGVAAAQKLTKYQLAKTKPYALH